MVNVDLVDVVCLLNGLDLEMMFVIVVLKMFIMVEIMLNARIVRAWIRAFFGEVVVLKYMVVILINLKFVEEFGIDFDNVFVFWDWVGG